VKTRKPLWFLVDGPRFIVGNVSLELAATFSYNSGVGCKPRQAYRVAWLKVAYRVAWLKAAYLSTVEV